MIDNLKFRASDCKDPSFRWVRFGVQRPPSGVLAEVFAYIICE